MTPGAFSSRSQQVIENVFAVLDYPVLAEIYCHAGGEDFWRERREAVVELGCLWSQALVSRLPRGGRSLYVGAGVAELPALVVEVLDLQRRVRICNRDARQCATLNRSLARAGLGEQISFEAT